MLVYYIILQECSYSLKPTNVENLYLLAGIAPPEIRRSVCARVERTKQVERETHSLFVHTPARIRQKSRRSILTSVQPVHFPAKVVRVNEWKRRLEEKAHAGLVNLYEDLATGHDSQTTHINNQHPLTSPPYHPHYTTERPGRHSMH